MLLDEEYMRAVRMDLVLISEELGGGRERVRGCTVRSLPRFRLDAGTSRHTPSAQTTAASALGSMGCTKQDDEETKC